MERVKPKVAIVRGKFLNKYEMQFFEPLVKDFELTAFGSLSPFQSEFAFPTVKLPCPMDLPEFPYKMPILNRLFVDAHYLWGLENKLDGFDLVHSAETYYHYTQQCLNSKRDGKVKKVIATVLENIPFNNEGIWGRKEFKARARKELDHMIALTTITKKVLLEEGADERKITVIHHHIDTTNFVPRKSGVGGERKDLTILFTGRLEDYKGVFDILESAGNLIKDKSLSKYNLLFLFVGDGGARGKMLEKIKSYGIERQVIFEKVIYSEMPGIYRKVDIFIAPSKPTPTFEEQYCTALLEAQACGLPIITTLSGGIPENVDKAAVLIKPGNVEEMTKALKDFIISPQKRVEFGKRARLRAVTVHEMKLGARAMKELYDKVLKEK